MISNEITKRHSFITRLCLQGVYSLRETDIQTDRQTDRQTEIDKDRERELLNYHNIQRLFLQSNGQSWMELWKIEPGSKRKAFIK